MRPTERTTLKWTIIIASISSFTATGCDRHATSNKPLVAGGAAVIDLDEVARRIGSDRTIHESITQRQSSLNQQLQQMAESYRNQIAERQRIEANQSSTEVSLATWEQQASVSLAKAKGQAKADLANHRTELVRQFRKAVKPAARKIANQRGLALIVTKNNAVIFDYSQTVDITNAVVQELLSRQPEVVTQQ